MDSSSERDCPLLRFDHIEFHVGNARQAASFYQQQFGFMITAYRGLETGERKATAYVLEQGDIRFVLTSALSTESPIARAVLKHGDSVAAIAFEVCDLHQMYHEIRQRGAIAVIPPTEINTEMGRFRYAAVQGYGDTLIKLIERQQYRGAFAPAFVPQEISPVDWQNRGLTHIDHVVGNVEEGAMEAWVNFFIKVFGFELLVHFDEKTIATEFTALRSKVVQSPSGNIKLPINEPAAGKRLSQIAEYLQYHHGPGVQHIALATDNIIDSVTQLKAAGVKFLAPPPTYYEGLSARVGQIAEPLEQLAKLGILVDRDADGYLLQIFTQPVQDRPTLFFEIIERHGSTGFGEGNFKALFAAIERQQALRGNL